MVQTMSKKYQKVSKFYAVAASLEADKNGYPMTVDILNKFDGHVHPIFLQWDSKQPAGYVTFAEVIDHHLYIEGELFEHFAAVAEASGEAYIAVSMKVGNPPGLVCDRRYDPNYVEPYNYGFTMLPSDSGLQPIRLIYED